MYNKEIEKKEESVWGDDKPIIRYCGDCNRPVKQCVCDINEAEDSDD